MNPPADSPARILMTADAVGGVWNYALELALELGRAGTEVILATMGPSPRPDQQAEAARLPNVTLRTSSHRLEWMDDPWDDVAAAGEWLLALEEEYAPDLIHLNGYAHGTLPWRAPVVVVGHSCVFSWWEAVHREAPPPQWDRYHQAVTAGLHAADLVVAPTSAMLAALQRHYGPLDRTVAIPNGRSPNTRITPAFAKDQVVLGVGRWWDEAKNCARLARAAAGLPWPLWLAGDVSTSGTNIPLPPNVKLLGRCSAATLASHYERAGIFAAPALYEPFGLAVLEAALAGCTLVLGDLPSLQEIWHHAAVFVPPEDENAIRSALHMLVNDPGHRRQLSELARQRALAFSSARMAAGYLSAYASARRMATFA